MKAPTLERREGKLVARFGDEGEPVAVRLVWARPLSGRGKDVSLLDEKGNEVAMLDCLDRFDGSSRELAREALEARYFLPRITRVLKAETHFGNRLVDVETDRGLRSFAVKDPNRNVIRVAPDGLIVCDTLGNRYEIPSMGGLDERSRQEMAKVL